MVCDANVECFRASSLLKLAMVHGHIINPSQHYLGLLPPFLAILTTFILPLPLPKAGAAGMTSLLDVLCARCTAVVVTTTNIVP